LLIFYFTASSTWNLGHLFLRAWLNLQDKFFTYSYSRTASCFQHNHAPLHAEFTARKKSVMMTSSCMLVGSCCCPGAFVKAEMLQVVNTCASSSCPAGLVPHVCCTVVEKNLSN